MSEDAFAKIKEKHKRINFVMGRANKCKTCVYNNSEKLWCTKNGILVYGCDGCDDYKEREEE